jgi:hypothetical protein
MKIKIFYKLLLISTILLYLASCGTNLLYKNQYQKLHDHKVSRILREIFDFYSRIDCRDSATKGARAFDEKQFKMLREEFLVLHIEKNEYDEEVIHIAIAPKNHPEKIRMWSFVLAESKWEKSGYEIIKFDEYPFKSKEGKKWPFDHEYEKYWLKSEI